MEKFKESQYYPYRSPSFERIGSSPLSPGDPTVDAVHRIEKDGWRVDEEIASLMFDGNEDAVWNTVAGAKVTHWMPLPEPPMEAKE